MFSLSSLGLKASDIKILVSMYLVVGFIEFLILSVLYIVKSVGLYYMSEQAGIKKKWYAFVPFFSDITIFELSHLYESKKSSKALSILHIFSSILIVLGLGSIIVGFVDTVFIADKALLNGKSYDISAIKPLIIPAIVFLLGIILTIIYFVLFYIYIYKIFNTFTSKNAGFFTVLSILLPFLLPFFLISASKNKPIFISQSNSNCETY